MLKSDIRALGVSETLAQLFDNYCDSMQDSDSDESRVPLLAKFMVAARREGFDFDGSHMMIAMPSEVWGFDIAHQNEEFADAMCAVLNELEDETGN